MSSQITTLEQIVENLDNRGLMVLQVLLGQQAMKLLEKEKTKEVLAKKKILLANA
jgi:hypothetical protein